MSAMAPAQRTIVSAELLYRSVYDEMMIFYVERLSRMAGPFFLPRVSTAAAPRLETSSRPAQWTVSLLRSRETCGRGRG